MVPQPGAPLSVASRFAFAAYQSHSAPAWWTRSSWDCHDDPTMGTGRTHPRWMEAEGWLAGWLAVRWIESWVGDDRPEINLRDNHHADGSISILERLRVPAGFALSHPQVSFLAGGLSKASHPEFDTLVSLCLSGRDMC